MKLANVIEFLQKNRFKLVNYGVNSLAVFGSVARDAANDTSDIDLLVTFAGKAGFDQYMDLKFFRVLRLAYGLVTRITF